MQVVKNCLQVGIHHQAEAFATEQDRENHDYVTWWTAVAKQLKDKEYRLSFNLFTELGIDKCRGSEKGCKDSLRNSSDKYKLWTSQVVKAIRETDGNKYLYKIDQTIYQTNPFVWHYGTLIN